VTTPALYSGELFFTNSISLSAVNARSGNIIWATSKVAATLPSNTPLLAYDNKVLYTNGQTVYAYYASNGTSAWSSPTVNPPRALIELGGNPEVGTSTGGVTIDYIYQLAQSGTYAQSFVNTLVTGSTNIAGAVNQIYYGQASSSPYTLNSIYANGTVASGFPLSTISQATGVAVYKNYVVYQTGNVVVSSSPSGTRYWNYFMPASFGAISGSGGLANATPVVTGTTIYTQWPRALVAQNLTTGAINWFALLPTTNRYPYMTLAYGKLYVIVNNDVRVYGSCNAPISATLLAAVATMEWNSQSGCDGALLNNVYPSANYTVFVGNPLPYTAQSASFNGAKGYISAHNSGYLNNSYVGVSFWVNISSYPATGVRLLNYGDNSTCASPVSQCGWFFYLKNSTIQFSVMSGSQTKVSGTPNLKKNKWYMITGVLNGTMVSLYINANTPATQSKTTGISPTSPNINLTIGAGLPTDTRYFTGNIANVQIYSKPYGISQVAQLYREGISGPPLKGQGLIAWYPLAGDANDYAFFNPGFLTGSAKFVTSKYTPPALSDAYEVSKAGSVLPVLNYTTGVGNTIQVGVYSWS
jgi:hypothetical protein